MHGLTKPEALPWAASSPAYDAARNQSYAFDLDRANSLLDAAGATDLEFKILCTTARPEHVAMATIYQGGPGNDWRQRNVKIG